MVGYGAHPPDPRWPDNAAIAVQFVLNYEEGSENSVLHGDAASETFLSEMAAPAAFPDRHMSMESLYEYGSRAGVWRILRLFDRRALPLTVFAVAQALARNLEVAAAFAARGDEIAAHGYRWLNYQQIDPAVEADHLHRAVELLTEITGSPPVGWYTGRDSPNTRSLVVSHGGFLYDSDSYADDLPYWVRVGSDAPVDHLVVPYTLDTNDMKFSSSSGFATGADFETYVCDAFDTLYAEGIAGSPKMLSVGLHCRLMGRPARIAALERVLDHIESHERVWIARRADIARHWHAHHRPTTMTR
ncbi:allantoinase PuuE [Williamsia sp. CHRR-6]|nr:allantoinase PuuE [Williamsia sp. CHRR-6]